MSISFLALNPVFSDTCLFFVPGIVHSIHVSPVIPVLSSTGDLGKRTDVVTPVSLSFFLSKHCLGRRNNVSPGCVLPFGNTWISPTQPPVGVVDSEYRD